MSDLDSLIGCKISLISHQNIRYDGTLFSISQSESSIVLKDVVNYGTEDRVTDKSKIVPPSSEVVKFITFPGQEIQDLYVHDESANAASEAPAPATTVATTTTTSPPPVAAPIVPPTPAPVAAVIPPIPPKPEPVPSSIAASTTDKSKTIIGAGSGSHLLKMKEKRTNDSVSKPISDLVKVDFDFQAGLNAFKNLTSEKSSSTTTATATYTYNKDNFFDDISTPTSSSSTRMTASEERALNQDTFGAVALQSRRYYNNRGGRGGNANRGYNNYNNRNNYNNNYNNNNNRNTNYNRNRNNPGNRSNNPGGYNKNYNNNNNNNSNY